MLKRFFVCAVLLFGLLSNIPDGYSTTLVPMNINEIITEAELIFKGTVSNVESQFGANGKNIYTYVTFEKLKIIKGIYPDATISVRLSGGAVGDYRTQIPGMPEFQPGGKHIIFLRVNGQYICPIVGWGQGKFNIIADKATGAEQVLDNANNPIVEIKGNVIIRVPRSVKARGGSFPGTSDVHGTPPQKLEAMMESGKRLMLPEFISVIEGALGVSREGRSP